MRDVDAASLAPTLVLTFFAANTDVAAGARQQLVADSRLPTGIALVTGKPVEMGISSTQTLLCALTPGLAMLSLNGRRTSPVQAWAHPVLFGLFGILLFQPWCTNEVLNCSTIRIES